MKTTQKTVSQSTFAQVLGVSRQRISRMVEEGLPVEKNGMIPRAAALSWVQRNILTKKSHAGQSPSLISVRVNTELLKQELLRMDLEERRGQLVSVAQAERAWANVGQVFRDSLLSLPERIAPQLAGLTDPRQVRDVLRTNCGHILTNIPIRITEIQREADMNEKPNYQANITGSDLKLSEDVARLELESNDVDDVFKPAKKPKAKPSTKKTQGASR